MGKAKTTERKQAQDLFVNTGLTYKEIGEMLKVSASVISKWSSEDSWDVQRTAKQNTAEKIIAGWYSQLAKINIEVDKKGGIPDRLQSDSMRDISSNIEKLSRKQNLSMYHTVLKEFLKELMTINVEDAKKFGPYMLDFMKNKASQLSDNK